MTTRHTASYQTWQRMWEMFFPWVTGTEDHPTVPRRRKQRKQH